MSEIGKIIRKIRKQQSLTQEQLALAIGYSDRSSIAKIEAGKTEVSQSQIKKISDVLCVSPLVLLGYEPNEEKLDKATIAGITKSTRNAMMPRTQPAKFAAPLDKYKDSLNEEGQKQLDEFYQFLLQKYGVDNSKKKKGGSK